LIQARESLEWLFNGYSKLLLLTFHTVEDFLLLSASMRLLAFQVVCDAIAAAG
jgi:hypothetical protein